MTERSRGELLAKAAVHPRKAVGIALSLLRGRLFLLRCRLLGRRVKGGRWLRISGRLIWRGPGTLVFGDHVHIDGEVVPATFSRDAVIEIGAHTYLNGTRLGCVERISIGSWCLVSDARIMDTDFHSLQADRHDPRAPVRVCPVAVSENVWIGAFVGILPGTRIGKNSVVGYGAVCAGEFPADVVIVGNPARAIGALPAAAAQGAPQTP